MEKKSNAKKKSVGDRERERLTVKMKAFCGLFCVEGKPQKMFYASKTFYPSFGLFSIDCGKSFPMTEISTVPHAQKKRKMFYAEQMEHSKKLYLRF